MLRFPKPLCLLQGKHSLSRGALNWFHNVSTYSEKIIEYNKFFTKESFKSKLKFMWKFGCILDIVGEPSMSRI